MNRPARRISATLLALALLTPSVAAAPADPASRTAGTAERWVTSLSDLLGGLVDRLWTTAAPGSTGGETLEVDDGDSELLPGWDQNGTSTDLRTSPELFPGWDPNG